MDGLFSLNTIRNLSSGIDNLTNTETLITELQSIETNINEETDQEIKYFPKITPNCIEFRNLTYSVFQGRKKGDKFILNNVSGLIECGKLTGIIGASGAGKTSLMNILAGFKSFDSNKNHRITGKLLINGEELDAASFRKVSSYVSQDDDSLFDHFSIKETMMCAANLKFSRKTKSEETMKIVTEILERLDLIKSQNTMIINISGGERKRLCIAMEFLNSPQYTFLDEPTSGLDSRSSIHCISLLKTFVNEGHTIVCTIHQPSSKVYEKFDNLIVMSNGHCVYGGKTSDLLPFLEMTLNLICPLRYNPADFVLNAINKKNGVFTTTLLGAMKSQNTIISNSEFDREKDNLTGTVSKKLENQQALDYKNDFVIDCVKFRILFIRIFLSTLRNKAWMGLRFIFHLFNGIIMGLLYFDIGNDASKIISNLGFLYFTQLFLIISSTMPMMTQYPIEKNIVIREYLNDWYTLTPYFFARLLADLPFQTIFSSMFISIVYWMSSQSREIFRFIYFLIISILTSFVGSSYGLMVGAGTNVEVAVFLGPVASIPFMVFSGYFIRFNAIPSIIYFCRYLSYIAFAFEGVVIVTYGYNRTELDCKNSTCIFSTPKQVLNEIGITKSEIYIDILGILVTILIFSVLMYFILLWRFKRKQ